MAIEISALTTAIGAEIRGVDLRTCDEATFADVRDALHEYQVVFVRGAHLDADDHLAVARRFGVPSIFPIARLQGATEPSLQVISDGPDSPPTAEMWHTDVTWISTPPRYALLCGEVIPDAGGDTLWASMTAAHDALSPTMQNMLAGLEVEHTTDSFVESILCAATTATGAGPRRSPRATYPRTVVHPLIRTHPENGRRILFIGGPSMHRIKGMRRDESDALLGFLRNYVTDERFQCRWRWSPGDLAIWDETLDHAPGRRRSLPQVPHGPKDRDRRRPALLRSLEPVRPGKFESVLTDGEKNDDSIQAAVGRARAGPQCHTAGRLRPRCGRGRRVDDRGGHVRAWFAATRATAARLSPAEPCRSRVTRPCRVSTRSAPSPPARRVAPRWRRSTTSRPLRRGYRTLRTATGPITRTERRRHELDPDPAGRSHLQRRHPRECCRRHRQHRPLQRETRRQQRDLVPKRGGGGVAEPSTVVFTLAHAWSEFPALLHSDTA